jgi:hypothetical protein
VSVTVAPATGWPLTEFVTVPVSEPSVVGACVSVAVAVPMVTVPARGWAVGLAAKLNVTAP